MYLFSLWVCFLNLDLVFSFKSLMLTNNAFIKHLKYLMKGKFKSTAFIWNRIFINIVNIFTVTFNPFNTYLLKKSINLFWKCNSALQQA